MMKKLIFAMLACISLVGCNERTMDGVFFSDKKTDMFTFVGRQSIEVANNRFLYMDVVYDNDTKVMYVSTDGDFTMLKNADGSPKIYGQTK